MIVAFIDAYRGRFGVVPICAVLSEHGMRIAPSTYYAAKATPVSDADVADAYAANALLDLWIANRGVYGVRKLWHEAQCKGHDLGRDQVGRLMAITGITGVIRGEHRTRTTEADPSAIDRYPDHVKRNWSGPTGTDQLWVADFTYVWTLAGFVYVAFVVDVFSRRILGWTVSRTRTAELVTTVLKMAVSLRGRGETRFTATGLLHHSDAGTQYTAIAFTTELREAGITGSIGSVGDALDNALMESAIGLFKTELIDRHPTTWRDRLAVETQTAPWVAWFNHERLHSSIGYIPPVEFEAIYHATRTTAALEPEAA